MSRRARAPSNLQILSLIWIVLIGILIWYRQAKENRWIKYTAYYLGAWTLLEFFSDQLGLLRPFLSSILRLQQGIPIVFALMGLIGFIFLVMRSRSGEIQSIIVQLEILARKDNGEREKWEDLINDAKRDRINHRNLSITAILLVGFTVIAAALSTSGDVGRDNQYTCTLLTDLTNISDCFLPHLIIGSIIGTVQILGTANFYKRGDHPEKKSLIKPNGAKRNGSKQSDSNNRVEENHGDPGKEFAS